MPNHSFMKHYERGIQHFQKRCLIFELKICWKNVKHYDVHVLLNRKNVFVLSMGELSLQGASKHAHRQRGVSGDTRPHDGLESM